MPTGTEQRSRGRRCRTASAAGTRRIPTRSLPEATTFKKRSTSIRAGSRASPWRWAAHTAGSSRPCQSDRASTLPCQVRKSFAVKAAVAEENKRAWDEPPCDPDGGFSVDLALPPSVAAAKAQFVRDMRDHLSFNPSCNFDLRERYDDRNWERIEQALADRPTTRLEPHDEGA